MLLVKTFCLFQLEITKNSTYYIRKTKHCSLTRDQRNLRRCNRTVWHTKNRVGDAGLRIRGHPHVVQPGQHLHTLVRPEEHKPHTHLENCPGQRLTLRGSVAFWPLDPDPGSGISFFPDPGSQTHIFESLVTNVWVKSSPILWKLTLVFFFSIFKNKIIINFVKFVATTKRYDKYFFFTPLFCCCFWIRDPRSGMGKNLLRGYGCYLASSVSVLYPDPHKF